MQAFDVTQKLLSWGPTYEVRSLGSEEVLMTVKGKVVSATPKLTLVQGLEGPEIAFMAGNFVKTKFAITAAGGAEEWGTITFPLIAWKKSFSLAIGPKEYKAEGGVLALGFKVADADGKTVVEIKKEAAFRDKFVVELSGDVRKEVALLAAVAIDQKYFQES